jgi:hypothetical protein
MTSPTPEDQEFLKHKLSRTPEYQFAEKLTKRFTKDLILYTSMAAEALMISNFRQKDSKDKVPLFTAFYANEIPSMEFWGVGFSIVLSSAKLNKDVVGETVREVIFNVDTKSVVIQIIQHDEYCDSSKDYGMYTLVNNKMDSGLLEAFVNWLIHESHYPPTPLTSPTFSQVLKPYTDDFLLKYKKQ